MEYKILKIKEELEQMYKLRKEVFVDEQKIPLEFEKDEKDDLLDTVHVGVFLDEKLVATARIMKFNDDVVYFGRACVSKKCRSLGVGKFLFLNMEKTVIENKKSNEKRTIKFSAQYHALKFYQMLGYSVDDGKIFLEFSIEHIKMSKIV